MKKYLYLLCLLCLFSASGCGADQKDTSDPIPNVLAMDDLSDAQASALLLGYSMGEAHTEMQTSPAWQGTYDEERTLVLDGLEYCIPIATTTNRYTTIDTIIIISDILFLHSSVFSLTIRV